MHHPVPHDEKFGVGMPSALDPQPIGMLDEAAQLVGGAVEVVNDGDHYHHVFAPAGVMILEP